MLPVLFLTEIGEPSVGPWTGLALGLLLVLLNGFFVAAEFALVKIRPMQLEPLVAQGSRSAKLARHMTDHLDAYLSASQLGITLASLALGWVGEPAFAWIVEPLVRLIPNASDALVRSLSISAAFLCITTLHIVVGEQAPKSFAIRRPAPTSLFIAIPLYAFYFVSFPAIWLLNRASIGLLKLLGLRPAGESEIAHSEEELRHLLASSDIKESSRTKLEILDNVFELSLRNARQVMVPRADVVYLTTKRPLEENLALARQSGHTRFPLCEGELDKVIGLIHIKDLFRAAVPPTSLEAIARPIRFVPESITLDKLLTRMRGERLHLAAVLDEYGGVSGIVTLENVMEEIVGEIQDEFDAERPELVDKGGGTYQVSGSMLLMDLEDALQTELSPRDEDTLGGVVLSELGRRPRVGDRVRFGGAEVEILEVLGNRIRTLRLTLPQGAAAAAKSERSDSTP